MNQSYLSYYILSALVVLIVLAIHEYSHAYTAYLLGDNTARNLGRLTINPIKHLDPVGALCMLFLHVGWAKPVPINPRNFKKPKRDFALVAISGPLTNIIIGFFAAAIYILVAKIPFHAGTFYGNLITNTALFFLLLHSINIGLGLFNLLPIPPFDGSRLLNVILPEKLYFSVMRHERKIYLFVLAWLILGDYVTSALRMIPIISATPWLNFIAGIFSLSDIISSVIRLVSNLIFEFWSLFPIFTF